MRGDGFGPGWAGTGARLTALKAPASPHTASEVMTKRTGDLVRALRARKGSAAGEMLRITSRPSVIAPRVQAATAVAVSAAVSVAVAASAASACIAAAAALAALAAANADPMVW